VASQKLYIRLLHRKYRWLSVHKIQYPEIGEDLTEQVIELITAGLLESGKMFSNDTKLHRVLTGNAIIECW
jgi:hypothetical protein